MATPQDYQVVAAALKPVVDAAIKTYVPAWLQAQIPPELVAQIEAQGAHAAVDALDASRAKANPSAQGLD